MSKKVFLFLQGPISPFFSMIGKHLAERGHSVHRINLSMGDWLLWNGRTAHNYRGRKSRWPAYVAKFMDDHKVTDIVLLGEQRDYHKAAISAAKARGIRVTVTDYGYLRPDWVTLERNGMSGDSEFPRDPEAIRALAERCPVFPSNSQFRDSFWGMALRDVVYHLSDYFMPYMYWGYRRHCRDNPILVYLGTLWRRVNGPRLARIAEKTAEKHQRTGAPVFVFPLQMAKDFQIKAYSPFDGLDEPISVVLRSFAAHAPEGSRLLVKVHPLDPGLRSWRRVILKISRELGITDRVAYLDGGNLDNMIRNSKGVVTINSTVGLRSLQLGKPTKTLGTAIYNIDGMVHGGDLASFWTAPQAPDGSLVDDFMKAMAATIQIRGVFYKRPGLDAAVTAAVYRLHHGLVNDIADIRVSTAPAFDAESESEKLIRFTG